MQFNQFNRRCNNFNMQKEVLKSFNQVTVIIQPSKTVMLRQTKVSHSNISSVFSNMLDLECCRNRLISDFRSKEWHICKISLALLSVWCVNMYSITDMKVASDHIIKMNKGILTTY